MKVLVDTSVWSLALRRSAPAHTAVDALRALIEDGRATIIGPIRQEVLSGIRDRPAFERLREVLQAFPDEVLTTSDYEHAAEHFNRCRQHGLQGSNTDFLICAVAERRCLALLTTDRDFDGYAQVIDGLVLYPIQPA
jgi:predicted nucleic acid-binding protein